MRTKSFLAALVTGIGFAGAAAGAEVIKFNPYGTGATNAIDVGAFDWVVDNALALGGNPAGGLVVGSKPKILAHARLAVLLGPNGETLALPADREFTFVAGYGEAVWYASPGVALFAHDLQQSTFFEIWTSSPNSNPLEGTGYNDGKRILYGTITNSSGNFFGIEPIVQFDQFPSLADNDYPGQLTVTGSGATQISVNVISLDADYFPGFTPAQVANLKAKFNTSTVVPYNQNNPSKRFVPGDAGANPPLLPPAPTVIPNLGTINGGLQNVATLDFQAQADSNQSFEPGEEVPGACRVTYGGNDRNGNIDLAKFGEACSPDGRRDENCYTFGGQVGAPTANPNLGGPFGEHTHHQKTGPAGDFVFHAGSRSAPKNTRITATVCKDPGACRQAEANASFKQIDFEGTGSFRTLDANAYNYFNGKVAGLNVLPDNSNDGRKYYFRVDMNDLGEPGNKWGAGKYKASCQGFFAADQNNPLATPDPIFLASFPAGTTAAQACSACPDTYQFHICKDENACNWGSANMIYGVRGFMTGGNIQIHKVIK